MTVEGDGRTRPAVAATRATLRQLFRKQRDSTLLLGVIAGFNLFLGSILVGVSGTGAYDLGRAVAAGDAAVTGQVRAAALSGLVLVSIMDALGAASDAKHKHHRVSFLTATSTGAVVAAVASRRIVASLVLFGPALLGAAVAFAAGASAPAAAVSLAAGSLWLVVAAAVWTLPLGLAANWVVAGYDLSGNARLVIGAAVLGVFYVALFGRRIVAAALGATPVAWVGDLLLVSVPGGGADPVRAAAFAVASLAAVAVAGVVSVPLASIAWYSDPAFRDEAGEGRAVALTDFGAHPLLAVVPDPRTAAIVGVTWRRTRRTPKTLFYVYPAVFVGLVMAEQLVLHGPFSPALYPVIVAVGGAAATGSGFTLNPLGTEGDGLPTVLTAGVGSGRLVRGKALAAALPGGALVLILGVGLGVSFALPVVVLAGLVPYAMALVALATLFSQGLGVHYPPDHEGLLGGGVKVPDKSASVLYSLGLIAIALPGFGGLGHYALTGVLDPLVIAIGVGITVLAALGVAMLSYRHAVSRLDAYSVE
jgi:ABC-2 type transport system permease protein